jgi:hypothetical protein
MHVYESEARLLFMRERADQLADEMRAARSSASGGEPTARRRTMLRAIARATAHVRLRGERRSSPAVTHSQSGS